MTWDHQGLKAAIREKVGGRKFIVVSNREPYIHVYSSGGIRCIIPASGMTTALDPGHGGERRDMDRGRDGRRGPGGRRWPRPGSGSPRSLPRDTS